MRKIYRIFPVFIAFILFMSYGLRAQTDYSARWKDFFSYHNVKDFYLDEGRIIALTDRGVFFYSDQDDSYSTFSSVNGMSGDETSCMYYNPVSGNIYIGYANGNMEIIRPDGEIELKVDIANYQATNDKSVNYIMEYGDTLYVSTAFGIVTMDMQSLEFGDTYYIGAGSSEIGVNETLIYNGEIYAAAQDGIYHADIDNPYLLDSSQWQHIPGTPVSNLVVFDGALFAASGETIYQLTSGSLVSVYTASEEIRDLNVTDTGDLLITTKHKVKSVDTAFQSQFQITSSYNPDFYFRANTAQYVDNKLYTATSNFGLMLSASSGWYDFTPVHPPGPSLNKPFSITADNGQLWVVYGGHNSSFEPLQSSRGVDHFDGENWYNIPYGSDGIPTKDNVDVTVDTRHENRVYIASYGEGVAVLEDHQLAEWWTPDNSPLEEWEGADYAPVRVSGSLMDEEGDLWLAQVAADYTLKKYNPENQQWNVFNISSIVPDVSGLGDITEDKSGNIWICTYNMGALVYNKNNGKKARFTTQNNHGSLPDNYVKAVAVDKDNRVWIGTSQGMVVFDSSDHFFNDDFNARPIVLDYGEDDQFGEALLGKQSVNDICVDGSDGKWFATNSGVLHTNSTGLKTLHLFHTGNSPLPSNRVLDIEFDSTTGLIYFATDKGIIAYDSGIAPYGEHLVSAYAFPNPVRKYHDYVTIDGRNGTHLPYGTNVKILDSAGHLVYETNVKEGQGDYGGRVVWDKTNLAGRKVASGIYIVLLTTKDTSESVMTKIAIIN